MRILKDLVAVIRRITIIFLINAQYQIWASPSMIWKPVPVPNLKWKPGVRRNMFRVRLEETLKQLASLRKIIQDKRNARRPQSRKTKTLRRLEKLKRKKIRKELESGNVVSISTLTEDLPTKKKSEDFYPLKARPSTNQQKGRRVLRHQIPSRCWVSKLRPINPAVHELGKLLGITEIPSPLENPIDANNGFSSPSISSVETEIPSPLEIPIDANNGFSSPSISSVEKPANKPHCGSIINDCSCIDACGSSSETIDIERAYCTPCVPRKSFQILYKNLKSKTNVLGVMPSTKISTIMRKIKEKEGIPLEFQRLSTFDGKDLDANCTISDYDIHHQSVLNLNLRLLGGMPKKDADEKTVEPSKKKMRGNGDTRAKRKFIVHSRSKCNDVNEENIPSIKSDTKIDEIVTKQASKCQVNQCRFRSTGTKGCFWEIFSLSDGTYDATSAYALFRELEDPVRRMNKVEKQTELERLFNNHSKLNTSTRKWEHNYYISVNGSKHNVCEHTFATVHGLKYGAFTNYAFLAKQRKLSDDSKDNRVPVGDMKLPYLDSKIHDFSTSDMMEMFAEHVPDLKIGEALLMSRSALTPLPDRQGICVAWLNRYFETYGDQAPNALDIKIAITFKKDLYTAFTKFCSQGRQKPVSYSRFCELWCVLFPYCHNRRWCNVPGKCNTCSHISDARNSPKYQNSFSQQLLQKCHAMHRGGLFMLERNKYRERVLEVLNQDPNNRTKMSIIIDGMDQSHCRIPYLGVNGTFGDPITQHITGVKEHGHGVTIYRTLETVSKGANLTIFCILSQLEAWKQRNGNRFPETLYIQLDGGSENANKYVLAMLELLVSKKIVKTIYFTRLPTGHTHEDIDGIFAVIWRTLRKKEIFTLEAYVKALETVFCADGIGKPVVKTPMLIPNYDSWLKEALDKKFARLHRGDLTQHCWRFEAVEPRANTFPTGCKTTYKAYSSDVVIEFRKVNPNGAQTTMGRHVGLEPYKVFNTWQPEPYGMNALSRGLPFEGTYILKHWNNLQWKEPGPVPLEKGSMASLRTTLANIKQSEFFKPFGDHKDDRVTWERWKDIFILPENKAVPDEDRTEEYMTQLNNKGKVHKHSDAVYRSPLRLLLFRDTINENVEWEVSSGLEIVNPEFEYPVVFQMATSSVVMEDNPNPRPPRFTAETDVLLAEFIDRFEAATASYYKDELDSRKFIKDRLQTMIRRSISYEVISQSVTGNKSDLIEKLLSWGSSFVAIFLRSTSRDPLMKSRIDKLKFANLPTSIEKNKTILALQIKTGIRNISALDAKSFSADMSMSENVLLGLLDLFQIRDNRIADNYMQVYSDTENYRPHKRSIFLSNEFISSLCSAEVDLDEIILKNFVGIDMREIHTVYFIFKSDEKYVLLFMSIDEGIFWFINPRSYVTSAVPGTVTATIVPKIKDLCSRLQLDCDNFQVQNYPYRYSTLESEGDIHDGVCIISVLYFCVMNVPIYFDEHSLAVSKDNFCSWLCISEELPY